MSDKQDKVTHLKKRITLINLNKQLLENESNQINEISEDTLTSVENQIKSNTNLNDSAKNFDFDYSSEKDLELSNDGNKHKHTLKLSLTNFRINKIISFLFS